MEENGASHEPHGLLMRLFEKVVFSGPFKKVGASPSTDRRFRAARLHTRQASCIQQHVR